MRPSMRVWLSMTANMCLQIQHISSEVLKPELILPHYVNCGSPNVEAVPVRWAIDKQNIPVTDSYAFSTQAVIAFSCAKTKHQKVPFLISGVVEFDQADVAELQIPSFLAISYGW